MLETSDTADLVAQSGQIADVLVALSEMVNEVRDNLSFVIIPIQHSKNAPIGKTLLKETTKVGLVPINGA
ncbi:MAG: hypothetical protein DMG92_05235 [Acidobacteria bacterium]|nr:MAG: hypothetical protein DMG92_05235 [Acidobacteriota bacterium]